MYAEVVVPTSSNGRAGQQELIERCLAGDPAAWDSVVRSYWKRVFNIAYKFVGRHDDAEDLTQEIFVRLLRALPSYDRRANFETWLTRVSRNHCIDHYRRLRRENQRITHDLDPEDVRLEDPQRRPDVTLEKEDEVDLVRKALAHLSPTLRYAVTLRDVHDLSYQEIAERLHLPEGTVKSRINRGRKELAKHLRVLQQPPGVNRQASAREVSDSAQPSGSRCDETGCRPASSIGSENTPPIPLGVLSEIERADEPTRRRTLRNTGDAQQPGRDCWHPSMTVVHEEVHRYA